MALSNPSRPLRVYKKETRESNYEPGTQLFQPKIAFSKVGSRTIRTEAGAKIELLSLSFELLVGLGLNHGMTRPLG